MKLNQIKSEISSLLGIGKIDAKRIKDVIWNLVMAKKLTVAIWDLVTQLNLTKKNSWIALLKAIKYTLNNYDECYNHLKGLDLMGVVKDWNDVTQTRAYKIRQHFLFLGVYSLFKVASKTDETIYGIG